VPSRDLKYSPRELGSEDEKVRASHRSNVQRRLQSPWKSPQTAPKLLTIGMCLES